MNFKFIYFIISSSFFVLDVLANDERMTLGDMVAALENFGESCDEKPKRDNILDILHHKKDVELKTKCFRRCLMELFELHDPESTKMRLDTTLQFGGMMYPERKDEFGLIVETCNARNANIEDACNAAHEHFVCVIDELNSNGFEVPEITEE